MELFFLVVLIVLMMTALGSGFPVAFALPGAAIMTILLAGASGMIFAGDANAYFFNSTPWQWLSAGVTNLRSVYWVPERDTLIAVPLFIFMGIMLQKSKIAEDLLVTMAQLFGPVPGGLGISVVFVGALLAATTGIVGATVVAMGLISLPAMMRSNYSVPLATGTIAASGTLGQIIPPSIVLIILADQLSSATDQAGVLRTALYKNATGEFQMPSIFDVGSTSAGEMFLGALVPGLVLVGLYMLYILGFALLRPSAAPAVHGGGRFDAAFWRKVALTLVPPLALIFLVLGSIIMGIATVNQAGAIGSAGAMVMAGYRLTDRDRGRYWPAILAILSVGLLGYALKTYPMNIKLVETASDRFGITLGIIGTVGLILALLWSGLRIYRYERTLDSVMLDTAKTTALVFVILMGAAILTAAFRAFGGEELVREFLNGLPGGFWAKFIVVMGVIFILGFFLDFIEISVVVVPIVAPILLADPSANVTAVWLGVMIGLNIQTSFLTPPFGFALFYLRGVAPAAVKTIQIYKGVIPFILLQLTALAIVSFAPPLVNYLPNRVSFLSETSPPPRNPRLQICMDSYVAQQIASNGDAVMEAIRTARALDLSYLPKPVANDLKSAFDNAEKAIAMLDEITAADAAVRAATPEYRPRLTAQRDLEKQIRKAEAELAAIEQRMGNLRNGDSAAQTERLRQKAEGLRAHIEELKAAEAPDWQQVYADFRKLVQTEDKARNGYRRAADTSYENVQKFLEILDSTPQLLVLEDDLKSLREVVLTMSGKEAEARIKQVTSALSRISGASDVSKPLSKLRRIMRRKEPKREAAMAELEKALAAFENQKAWRARAEAELRPALNAYLDAIRGNLGVRSQPRMTREQALFAAWCSSSHRDISLNF